MKLLLHDYGGYPFTLQLAETLAQMGVTVRYMSGGGMQPLQRAQAASGVAGLSLDSAAIPGHFDKYNYLRRWFQEREYGQRLVQRVAEFSPDVIVSSVCPLDAQHPLIDYANKHQKKFVFWWQDINSLATKKIFSEKSRVIGYLLGEHYLRMERNQLRKSDQVIAITEDFREMYHRWRLDETKFHILPNWAPLNEIAVLPKENEWAQRHGLADRFVFLYSGVFALKHNPGLLNRLADHMRMHPDVIIVLISEGPGAEWLKQHARPNLRVLPFQSCQDYPWAIAAADVLMTILNDHAGAYSVPSKVLSYLCAGRPQLAAVPPENQAARLLGAQKAGLVSAPNRPDQFCAFAEELYRNPSMRKEMARNGRNYAEKAFDIRRIANQFLKILCM